MKKTKLLIGGLLSVMLLTSCGNYVNNQTSNSEYDKDVQVSDDGAKVFKSIKRNVSGTDSNGFAYQTFSYTVSTIGDNTSPTVAISISFADGRNNASDYLVGTVDSVNKEFTITCKNAFNSVATARLYIQESPQAYANITINYSQKLIDAGFDFSSVYNYTFQSNKYNVTGTEAEGTLWVSDSMPRFRHIFGSFFTMNVSQYTNFPLNYPAANNYSFAGFDDDATPSWPTSNMQRHWISDRFIKSNSGTYNGVNLDTLNDKLYRTAFSGYSLSWDQEPEGENYGDQLLSLYYRLSKTFSSMTAADKQIVKNCRINGKLPCKFTVGGDYVLMRHSRNVKNLTSGSTLSIVEYDENYNEVDTGDVLESVYIPSGCYFIVMFDWLDMWDYGQISPSSVNIQF